MPKGSKGRGQGKKGSKTPSPREASQSEPQNTDFSRAEGGVSLRGASEVSREFCAEVRQVVGGFGEPEPSPQVQDPPPLTTGKAAPPGRENTPQVSVTPGSISEVGPAQPRSSQGERGVSPGEESRGDVRGCSRTEDPEGTPQDGAPGPLPQDGQQRYCFGDASAVVENTCFGTANAIPEVATSSCENVPYPVVQYPVEKKMLEFGVEEIAQVLRIEVKKGEPTLSRESSRDSMDSSGSSGVMVTDANLSDANTFMHTQPAHTFEGEVNDGGSYPIDIAGAVAILRGDGNEETSEEPSILANLQSVPSLDMQLLQRSLRQFSNFPSGHSEPRVMGGTRTISWEKHEWGLLHVARNTVGAHALLCLLKVHQKEFVMKWQKPLLVHHPHTKALPSRQGQVSGGTRSRRLHPW